MTTALAVLARADAGAALSLIGWLVVIGCLIAAAVAAFRALWVACGLLLVVAIVAGFLLL